MDGRFNMDAFSSQWKVFAFQDTGTDFKPPVGSAGSPKRSEAQKSREIIKKRILDVKFKPFFGCFLTVGLIFCIFSEITDSMVTFPEAVKKQTGFFGIFPTNPISIL